jgi:F-type H+-transporting ATPase subunit a
VFYSDPLEQFSIESYVNYYGSMTVAPYTILGKMVLFNMILMSVFLYSQGSVFKQNKLQKFVRTLFKFVVGVVKNSVGVLKYSFVLLLFCMFIFVFLSNLLGMLPYSIAATSHLIVTLFFSLAFFIGNNLIGVCYHTVEYFVLFLPEGVPVLIIPILILIEYVSYISRIFSLAIRLFANMMAGHILLKILISFIWIIGTSNIIHWC